MLSSRPLVPNVHMRLLLLCTSADACTIEGGRLRSLLVIKLRRETITTIIILHSYIRYYTHGLCVATSGKEEDGDEEEDVELVERALYTAQS